MVLEAEATGGTSEISSKKETKTDKNLVFIRINLFSYSFFDFFWPCLFLLNTRVKKHKGGRLHR